MKEIKIPKKRKKGEEQKYRNIFALEFPWEKKKYRSLAWLLEKEFLSKEQDVCVHGFLPTRNCVTNAKAHINKQFTLSMDLKSFFDYVSVPKLVENGLDRNLAKLLMVKGRARQGLSSSPMAANIAAMKIDKKILELLKETDCIYTRYADDLTISSNHINLLKQLRIIINSIVKESGFKINHKKTRIQSANFGRRKITGIAVDDKCYPTRANKRKLRALKFKYNNEKDINKKEYYRRQIAGMEEFIKCKEPNINKLEGKYPERKTRLYPSVNNIEYIPYKYLDPSWVMYKNKFNYNMFKILINRIGIERCINFLHAMVLDANNTYRLLQIIKWDKNARRGINRIYLEMKNPSVEGLIHIEPVHPRCRTIQQAINYRRFGTPFSNTDWKPEQLS